MLTLFRSWLIGVGLLALTCVSWAADPEFLRPEQAFQVSARADGSDVVLTWQIAESYYLYRKRFKTKTDTEGAEFGDMVIPTGTVKNNEYFGKSEVYRGAVSIRVPLRVSSDATEVAIAATSQGCADAGLCYPPDTRQLRLAIASAMRVATATTAVPIAQTSALSPTANTLSAATLSATVAEAGATSKPPTAAPADPDKVKLLSNLLGLGPKKAAGALQSTPLSDAVPAKSSALDALTAFDSSIGLGSGQPEFLGPEVAFLLSSELRDGKLQVRWAIQDAYYLYRKKFAFSVLEGSNDFIGTAEFTPAKLKHDEYFGDVEVYYGVALAAIPVLKAPANGILKLQVTYQGCADAGLCYPPIKKILEHTIPVGFIFAKLAAAGAGAVSNAGGNVANSTGSNVGSSAGVFATASSAHAATASSGLANRDTAGQSPGSATGPAASAQVADTVVSEQDQLTNLLAVGSLWIIITAFFVGGLLLSLTPCVFPMIPILSSIIVGQGKTLSRSRALFLSFLYVQGVALTYTVVGVVAGLTGANLAIIFQDPYVLTTFAMVFVLLALSMFGFYELQLPSSWQSRLNDISNRQRGGSYWGVAIMGVLSALIVGPCVAPPLFGALAYISSTGDAVLGGIALYALSMGMGVPLLVVGVSAGTLLPRAGAWMESVKQVFGVMLLAVAVFFLERILPGVVSMVLWATLLIVSAIYLGALDQLDATVSGWKRLWKGVGLVLLTYGVLLMVGASGGNTDPLQPLKGLGVAANSNASSAGASNKLQYRWIKGVDGLDEVFREARASNKMVMLDYYADWCISCKEMDKFTFTDAGVRQVLANIIVLKTDVTANDNVDKALMDRFGLFGPPTIQFFTPDGVERKGYRVVGFMSAKKFKQHVENALSI